MTGESQGSAPSENGLRAAVKRALSDHNWTGSGWGTLCSCGFAPDVPEEQDEFDAGAQADAFMEHRADAVLSAVLEHLRKPDVRERMTMAAVMWWTAGDGRSFMHPHRTTGETCAGLINAALAAVGFPEKETER